VPVAERVPHTNQLGEYIGHGCTSVGLPPSAAAWEAYYGWGGAIGRGTEIH
jgi:hypothetical protein